MSETWHGYAMERFTFEDREAIVVFPKEVRPGTCVYIFYFF